MNNPMLNLIAAQFKEFFREPEALFWALLFPLALAGVLGLAFLQQDQMTRAVGVLQTGDHFQTGDITPWGKSGPGREATGPAGDPAPNFKFRFFADPKDAVLALKRGEINLFLETPRAGAPPCYHFDPHNSEAQLTYLGLERERLRNAGAWKAECVRPLAALGTRYIDFLIPGLLAMGILNSSMWGIGWALIERRMKKLLRRMAATPMRKHEFFLSFFTTRLCLSLFEVLVLCLFAYGVFGVRIQGTWPAFGLVFFSGNLAFGGIALLSASRVHESQAGNGILNAVSVPMMILSGIFFSYHNFPGWLIHWVQWLPLTVLADSFRKVFIEGAGIAHIAAPSGILILTGLACFAVGQRIFKWT